MANIASSVTELIGRTPLLRLKNIEEKYGLCAKIVAKLEYLNPAGSAKDRVALAMINKAEKDGRLKKGSTIIEPTSGNTGIGLASVAAARGYRAVIVMPDTMSVERIKTMKAYGAEVVLTDGKLGMQGSIDKANELLNEIPHSIIAGQFDNPANALVHRETTGPEIYEGTDGDVDFFVAGVGTGGTITGVGQYLKERKSDVKIIAVEPSDSPLLSQGKAGPHKIQGIGANFIPKVLDTSIYDEIITVSADDAYDAGRVMGSCEGVLVGISSGAAICGAIEIAKREENFGKTIVVLLPDTGARYLSTEMFE